MNHIFYVVRKYISLTWWIIVVKYLFEEPELTFRFNKMQVAYYVRQFSVVPTTRLERAPGLDSNKLYKVRWQ